MAHEDIVFSKAERMDRSFVTEGLREPETDLIWKLRFQGEEVYLYAGLARFARAQKERLDRDTKREDRVWLVFDADENCQSQLDAAAKSARQTGARIGFSTPCFELWYLLHFENRLESLDRTKAVARLRGYIPDYDKAAQIGKLKLHKRGLMQGLFPKADEDGA